MNNVEMEDGSHTPDMAESEDQQSEEPSYRPHGPLDLRLALNALSDIIANRPHPIRKFDQIYMKAGDMIIHAEYMCRKADGRKKLVFVGDGDAIGLCMAHLQSQGLINYGPRQILLLDFDERMVNSVNRFAADKGFEDRIRAKLYNVIDPLPEMLIGSCDAFHINPPWGQYNGGESVVAFMERGVQLLENGGIGVVVIGDDPERVWTREVLSRTQAAALGYGLIVSEMQPHMHLYHLPDAADLRSCAMIVEKFRSFQIDNAPLEKSRLENFYGRDQAPDVRYVRERSTIARGAADPSEYHLDMIDESQNVK